MNNWRKSSYSGDGGSNCIEVADDDTRVSVRDTQDRQGPVFRFTPDAWRRFAGQVKAELSPESAIGGARRRGHPLLLLYGSVSHAVALWRLSACDATGPLGRSWQSATWRRPSVQLVARSSAGTSRSNSGLARPADRERSKSATERAVVTAFPQLTPGRGSSAPDGASQRGWLVIGLRDDVCGFRLFPRAGFAA